MSDHIIDVLGRTRPIEKIYPNGSWNCPFCAAAVLSKNDDRYRKCHACNDVHCQNPACFANPHYPVDRARREHAAQEARRAEEAQRQATVAWRNKYHEEQRQERAKQLDEITAEAKRRGACVRCALKDAPYRVKYIKHRGACPLSR